MTRIANEQIAPEGVSERPVEHIRGPSVEIKDPRLEETYTASLTRTATGWSGQIPDIPEVQKCHANTKQALLAALKEKLYEFIQARSEAWDKQIEEDIKAGRLDPLRQKALEDVKAGRFTTL